VYHIGESFYAVPQGLGRVEAGTLDWQRDERTIPGSSFDEIRRIIDEANDVELLETIGRCSVCRVGTRLATIPHSLGIIDFHIPAHRENPGIVWKDRLEDAREAARRIAGEVHAPDPANGLQVDGLSSGTTQDVRLKESISTLEDRIMAVEAALPRLAGGEEQIAALQSDLKAASDILTSLRDAQSSLERQISELRVQSTAADSRVDGFGQSVDIRIARMQSELSGLERGIQSLCRSRIWRTLRWAGGVALKIYHALGMREEPNAPRVKR
jgi:hypothetical protein